MPQIQYPFIDIAVHPIVRARFAAGEAIVLFTRDLDDVLWANGEGAQLFGFSDIYDLLEDGPDRSGVSFRQLAAAARQLNKVGDRRSLMMRVASGFSSQLLSAEVSLVEIRRGEIVVIFSTPVAGARSQQSRIQSMLKGFEDPDTHMAVLSADGDVMAASPGFAALGILPETARALIGAVERSPEGLIKRPIASSAGYLPAAIGKLSDDPALHLLFCVETVLGRMDPPPEQAVAVLEEETATEVSPVETIAADVSAEADAGSEAHFASDVEPGEFVETATDDAEFDGAEAQDEPEPVESLGMAEVASHEADLTSGETSDQEVAEAATAMDVAADEQTRDEQPAQALEDAEIAPAHEQRADFAPPEPATDWADVNDAQAEDALTPDHADSAVEDTVTSQAASEPALETEPAPSEAFVFAGGSRPVRFVWKLDAQGRFSDVSEEFSRTVGPHSGAVKGRTFQELANLLALDPEGEIGKLLERRDTWSGRTIRWPIEGTDLVAPVDLAALPTYSRNREFDGFRGFGIIRVADVERDPHAMGMAFRAEPEPQATAPAEDPAKIEEIKAVEPPEAGALTSDHVADAAHENALQTADDADEAFNGQSSDAAETAPSQQTDELQAAAGAIEEDDFRGEQPAIRIVTDPVQDLNEKVIKLEERRARGRDEGLSQSEQAALREIARQLEPFGKRPNEDVAPAAVMANAEAAHPVEKLVEEIRRGRTENENPVVPASEEVSDAVAGDVDHVEPEAPIALPVRADDSEPDSDEDSFEDKETAAAFASRIEALGLTAVAADQVPLAMLVHAGDRLIHANPEFRRFTGYETLDALVAAGGLDALIHRADGAMLLMRADGERVPVTARLQSIRFHAASALLLTLQPAPALLPDPIEEDEQSARRLAAMKVEMDELHSILETATDGVIVLDTDGRIRSMNRSASALFNFDDTETRGKPFAMLFAHESQKAVQDYLWGLSGHGVASVLNDGREVIGREASGGFIPLFMTMGRMPGSNSYCAVIRDITQWKRSEEELRAAKRSAETANQHKSDFLARVSHEIRTPLNAIIGFSDMIASEHFGPAGNPRYVEYAHDIGRSGRHVLDIVNDLLDISKIEAGEMDLEFAAVGINDCLSEAVALVQQQANAQRVIIRTSLSQSVPNVVADLRSVKQIAINILANAIRFTPAGGQIVVSTAYEPSGSVALRIRDTGVGMSTAEMEQAMRPFGQVSPGARKRGDGTGLGLPLTKAMTEANRALFAIHSAPNEGTLVEITFPPQRVLAD